MAKYCIFVAIEIHDKIDRSIEVNIAVFEGR